VQEVAYSSPFVVTRLDPLAQGKASRVLVAAAVETIREARRTSARLLPFTASTVRSTHGILREAAHGRARESTLTDFRAIIM
jgi:hypothetical protein